MSRLSLYKPTKGYDFKFLDKTIHEQFVIGGTGINVHKYLGPVPQESEDGGTPTEPNYTTDSVKNIQDLLFLENRDRKYDKDILYIKGVYNVQDIDFDLSQFGLFLQSDTLFLSFHIIDMIEVIGRKLIAGDVIELPHLEDDYALEDDRDLVYDTLKRYYVIQEGSRSSEGFSQTWYPHIWRVKCTPLIDAQEYRDIIGEITGGGEGEEGSTIKDILSTYQTNLDINNAIIASAEQDTLGADGRSGYNTSHFWIAPRNEDGSLQLGTADEYDATADSNKLDSSYYWGSPDYDQCHYLAGDGVPPNGFPVSILTQFPENPTVGEYVLRTDFQPNRLYIFNSSRWVHVEDDVTMTMTNSTDRETFRTQPFNNKDSLTLSDGSVIDSKTSLSEVLKIREDD
jgi:hypothetical protein